MTRPAIIYVSGPMTTGGNVPVNIRRGIEAAVAIMERGYVVLCPHEKAFGMEMLAPRSYEDWMQYDFKCVQACDAVYRMSDGGVPLPSAGGDRECVYAREIGRPVYYSYDTLFACVPVLVDVAPLYTLARPEPYAVDVGGGPQPGID
jgi:hypothetical protein